MIKFWFNRIYIDHKATIEDCPARYRDAVLEMARASGYAV